MASDFTKRLAQQAKEEEEKKKNSGSASTAAGAVLPQESAHLITASYLPSPETVPAQAGVSNNAWSGSTRQSEAKPALSRTASTPKVTAKAPSFSASADLETAFSSIQASSGSMQSMYDDLTKRRAAADKLQGQLDAQSANLERLASDPRIYTDRGAAASYISARQQYDTYTDLYRTAVEQYNDLSARYTAAAEQYETDIGAYRKLAGQGADFAKSYNSSADALDKEAEDLVVESAKLLQMLSYGSVAPDKILDTREQAKRLQEQAQQKKDEAAALRGKAQNAMGSFYSVQSDAADFDKYSKAAGSKAGSTEGADPVYDFINDLSGFRDRVREGSGAQYTEWAPYSQMTDQEVATYNYLYAKNGKEAADQFLAYIQETLNARQGEENYKNMSGVGKALYWLPQGLNQWESGFMQLFSEDALPTSAVQYTGQAVQQELEELPGVWGTLAAGAYGLGTTVANMLPSIMVSYMTGGMLGSAVESGTLSLAAANKIAGATGSLLMGGSAGGNAYNMQLKEGWTKEQAKTYATMVGASESLLQYLLGGIGRLGKGSGAADSIVNKVLTQVARVDNTIARSILEGGVRLSARGSSEAFEEMLQEVLEPGFASIIHGDKYDVDLGNVLYAGIMGFLSAGIFEAGDVYRTVTAPRALTAGINANTQGYLGASGIDWFEGCNTAEELKARYRELQKQYHPDNAGENAQIREINNQYEMQKAYYTGAETAVRHSNTVYAEPAAAENTKTSAPETSGRTETDNRIDLKTYEQTVAEAESTAVNDNPAEHSAAEQRVIEEYKNATNENLVAYYNEHKTSQEGKPFYLKPVGTRASADIETITGQKITPDFRTRLDARQAWHINNDHGTNGRADQTMADDNDVGRMQYVLDHYDMAEYGGTTDAYWETKVNGKNRQAPVVVFSKKVNGTYYVVEAVPVTKARTVNVVSAYMLAEGKTPPGRLGKKTAEGTSQPPDADAPWFTAKTDSANASSAESRIARPTESVNTEPQRINLQTYEQTVQARNERNGGITNGEQRQQTAPADGGAEAARTDAVGAQGDLYGDRRGREHDGDGRPGAVGVREDEGRIRGGTRENREIALKRQRAAADQPLISAADAGVYNGTEDQTLRILPESEWDDEANAAEELCRRNGIKSFKIVVGSLTVDSGAGPVNVMDVVAPGAVSLVVRGDSLQHSLMETVEHAICHVKATEERVRAFMDSVKGRYKESAWRAMYEKYLVKWAPLTDDYAGMTDSEIELYVWEEILGDAYAGLNCFGTRASAYRNEARAAMSGAIRAAGQTTADSAATEGRTAETPEARGPPRQRYMYAGRGANGANSESLAEAERLEMEGTEAEDIRRRTGWFRGADGQWRFEIDDSDMEYRRMGDAGYMDDPEYREYLDLWDKVVARLEGSETEQTRLRELDARYKGVAPVAAYKISSGNAQLQDILIHDELFEDYPQLRTVGVRFADLQEGTLGSYSRSRNEISLDNSLRNAPESTLIHEIQHAIQQIEGFAGGANPEYWDERVKNGYDSRTKAELRRAEDLQREYDAMAARDPQFIEDMEALDATAPDLPRGAFDPETWEQIEEDPVEWQRFDERREMLEAKYGEDAVWDFFDLKDRMKRAQEGSRSAYELYRNTAGEIEARDAASRRNLPAEERRKTPPNIGDEDVAFTGKDEGAYLSAEEANENEEILHLKEQIRANLGSLNEMPSVADVDTPKTFPKRQSERRAWVLNTLRTNEVDRPGFGVINIGNNQIAMGLSYAKEPEEIAAFAALPRVLKRGKEIERHSNHKSNNIKSVTFAAPVTINGKPGLMAAVVRPTKGNNYKAHAILMPDGSAFVFDEEQKNEADLHSVMARPKTGRLDKPADSASEQSIAEPKRNVKYHVEEDELEAPKSKRKPSTESRPIISKSDLRKEILKQFSIPDGMRAEIGSVVDGYADRMLAEGKLTQRDYDSLIDRLYASGVVEVAAEPYLADVRRTLASKRIYIPDRIKPEFGDDWNSFRRRAFAAGIYLTSDPQDMAPDVVNAELAEQLPGMFDADETDDRTILEQIVGLAEEGKDQKMSLADYTAMLADEGAIDKDQILDDFERKVRQSLEKFAEKAKLEITLRDRTGVKLDQQRERYRESIEKRNAREIIRQAKERERRLEAAERQREHKELRELQQRTLKQLQWLSKNQFRAPEELRSNWEQVLGDIDIYAVGAANELHWSKKHQATWRDLADMYKAAKENDPNFLPSEELKRIVARLDNDKIADMDIAALKDLYKAAVGLRKEFYNRNNVIADEQHRMFADVYADAKREIVKAHGGADISIDENGYITGKPFDQSGLGKIMTEEQLTPINYLERMGGWNPEGQFFSMAKQLERGENDMRDYIVRAKALLDDFNSEHKDWIKTADGQGKKAVWYEIEVPELLQFGFGDKPLFGDTVKVYMTPMQKVHMYLESQNYDNLRHMAGGRTFVNKELYSKGKYKEAFAQGTTVRLAPETVKKLVSNLTEEERALADVLRDYYNNFAAGKINAVADVLYGYPKAMSGNYAPIYTNKNYVRSEIGVYDATPESIGNLKARQHSANPSYNLSAIDAFERHVGQTARFVGMAIPARNWQTLLNWREKNTSMGDVITHKWGAGAKKYIEDLLVALDVGGGGEADSEFSKGLNWLLSNYISGVFGFNPGIMFKQAASFPQFAAALGWNTAPNPVQIAQTSEDLINTYTSALAYRKLGYATPETAQLAKNQSAIQRNKALRFAFGGGNIIAMDGATVKAAWPWAVNYVRKNFPNLETGTQEQIDSGESPFYKKVAEVYENAVGLTQPMYDEMHRPWIMKNSKGIVRAFTMFKTVPLQQMNSLRRAYGELRYYSEQQKSAGNDAQRKYADGQRKKAARRAAAATSATIASILMLEAIEFLNQLWKNKGKKYRDDEDNSMTLRSVAEQVLKNSASDAAGMVVGGGELADLLENLLLGEKWYGIDIPGGEQLNTIIDSISSTAGKIAKIVGDAANITAEGGDLGEYLDNHRAELMGLAKDLGEKAAVYMKGFPVENIEKYIMGTLQHVDPKAYTAVQDMFKAPTKASLKQMEAEPEETVAQKVSDLLKQRGVNLDNATAQALAELYRTGENAAVPAATPSSITVDKESRNLTAYQQQVFDKSWSAIVNGNIADVVSSREYRAADETTRSNMLEKLYSYAAEAAKEDLFRDYERKKEALDADEIIASGISTAEWAIWAGLTQGAENSEKYAALAETDFSEKTKIAIAGSIMGTEMYTESGNASQYAKMLGLVNAGLSVGQYLDLKEADAVDGYIRCLNAGEYGITPETYLYYLQTLPEYDADENGSFTQAEMTNAVSAIPDIDDDQRAVLWQTSHKNWKANKNPFSYSVGSSVYDAINGETDELPVLKLPTADDVMPAAPAASTSPGPIKLVLPS